MSKTKEIKPIDVLCVGDTVVDIWIKLNEETSHTYANENGPWLALPFATKIPYEETEVQPAHGNAANAAVAMSRLGLRVAYQTYVGGDQMGRETIRVFQKEKVDTRFITIENAADYHDEIADWLEAHPEVKMAFQPGTWQMKAGVERLKRIYARAEVVIMNRQEAAFVTGGSTKDLHDLFDRLHSYGPKMAVITDGPDGAYASDGVKRFKMPLYPDPKPPVERTGAGDAYASTVVAALVVGHDLESALQWAPINSMNVVQHPGSQTGLLSEKELEAWLAKAPDWYHSSSF